MNLEVIKKQREAAGGYVGYEELLIAEIEHLRENNRLIRAINRLASTIERSIFVAGIDDEVDKVEGKR